MVDATQSSDPNFPDHLDIEPSGYPHAGLTGAVDDDVFGNQAQRNAIRKYGIAGRVWEAAYALNLYVHPPPNWEYDPPFVRDELKDRPLTMIELGSGLGMVSSSVADILHPSRDILIATDLSEVCPLLEKNLVAKHQPDASRERPIFVRPLAWGNDNHTKHIASEFFCESPSSSTRHLTHIICSDLVYFPELLAPLLRTLIQLSQPSFCPTSDANQDLTIVISYKIRSLSKETPFWSAFGLWFKFEPVLVKHVAGWQRFSLSSDDTIFVIIAHRRSESFTWDVPLDDDDLLDGVGAQGTDTRKGDDAFEILLFFAIDDIAE